MYLLAATHYATKGESAPPTMADLERNVLEFYGVQSLFPDEWPNDKGNSDASEDESQDRERKAKLSRRKSRYQALERTATNRSGLIPGSEKGNLVQRDEPDPLGTTDSVVMTLKRYGVPIKEDPRLRKCFACSLLSTPWPI